MLCFVTQITHRKMRCFRENRRNWIASSCSVWFTLDRYEHQLNSPDHLQRQI